MAFGEGKNRRQTTVGKGALGRGMRIATGAERPRNDRSRKNLRVIPRPVRRLVVGIRNTPAQRSRRTDCHSQCAHWLRNDMVFTRGAVQVRAGGQRRPGLRMTRKFVQARFGPMWASAPTKTQQEVQWAGDRKGRPYEGLRGMCGLGIGPCGSFLTGREWYVSDFGGGG